MDLCKKGLHKSHHRVEILKPKLSNTICSIEEDKYVESLFLSRFLPLASSVVLKGLLAPRQSEGFIIENEVWREY